MKLINVRAVVIILICSVLLNNSFVLAECNSFLNEILRVAIQKKINEKACHEAVYFLNARIAIDKPHHEVKNVCYESLTETSLISAKIHFKCKTSPAAVFKTELNEKVHIDLNVRNSDCKILDYNVGASGFVGDNLIQLADLFNMVEPPIQDALNKHCKN